MKFENDYNAILQIDPETGIVENIYVCTDDEQSEHAVRQALENLVYPNCEYCIQQSLTRD